VHRPGESVQVDPIKPKLKPPGNKRLTPKYDKPLSRFTFNFNLRRYNPCCEHCCWQCGDNHSLGLRQGLTLVHISAQLEPCLTPKDTLDPTTHTKHPSTPP